MKPIFKLICFLLLSVNIYSQSLVGKNKLLKPGDKLYNEPEPITSELYKSNIGKIVFSNKPIDVNGAPSQLRTTFNIGEPIYCAVFLETSLGNYLIYDYASGKMTTGKYNDSKWYSWGTRSYIDDFSESDKMDFEKHNFAYANSESGTELKKYFTFQLGKGAIEFSDQVNKLPNGVHKVKIVFIMNSSLGETKKPIANGEFILNKTDNAVAKTGVNFNDIKSKMADSSLEASAVKLINDYKYEISRSTDFTTLKAKIVSEEWNIVRNEKTGVIVGRTLDFALLRKDTKGACSIVVYSLQQDFNGEGYQKTLKYFGTPSALDHKDIFGGGDMVTKVIACDCD